MCRGCAPGRSGGGPTALPPCAGTAPPSPATGRRTTTGFSAKPGARPAGRQGIRPLPAALAREVRIRLLSSQPGRLPRLGPGGAGRPPVSDWPGEPRAGPLRVTGSGDVEGGVVDDERCLLCGVLGAGEFQGDGLPGVAAQVE